MKYCHLVQFHVSKKLLGGERQKDTRIDTTVQGSKKLLDGERQKMQGLAFFERQPFLFPVKYAFLLCY